MPTDPEDACPKCLHSMSTWHGTHGCDMCDCESPFPPADAVWKVVNEPPAPSVRRAQIPVEARLAMRREFWRAAPRNVTETEDALDVALAAAAPVLLSEYQQRIEAAEAIPAKPHAFHAHPDSRLAGWIDGYNYARDNFRAALGSTKPAGSE